MAINNADYVNHGVLLDTLKPDQLKVLYRSCQLLNWHIHSNVCGCCGGALHMDTKEFAKVCETHSTHRYYPHYSPAMIVLISHEDKFLLGRSAKASHEMYSTLAGFLEAGETGEDAVKREVMEEVGIEVKNICLISATPWPFPNSLMLAYTAEAVTTELEINRDELTDAQWFNYKKLPVIPPKSTISYALIQRGVQQCEQAELLKKRLS